MAVASENGWPEYQRLVLDRLDRLDGAVGGLRADVITLRESVAGLRVKASVWGAIAGMIPVAIALGIALWKAGMP